GGRGRDRVPPDPGLAPLLRRRHTRDRPAVRRDPARRRGDRAGGGRFRTGRPRPAPGPGAPRSLGGRVPGGRGVPAVRRPGGPQGPAGPPGALRRARPAALRPRLGRFRGGAAGGGPGPGPLRPRAPV
ncbi:MAG: FIG028593: membrane protein, partial [uncultured Pseudonocardia sp.]